MIVIGHKFQLSNNQKFISCHVFQYTANETEVTSNNEKEEKIKHLNVMLLLEKISEIQSLSSPFTIETI